MFYRHSASRLLQDQVSARRTIDARAVVRACRFIRGPVCVLARKPVAALLSLRLTANRSLRSPGAELLQIVPLALQTVVENALKHNVYSAGSPLMLKVFTDDDQLVVENTLNRRENVVSMESGLENLRTRVQHVCGKTVQVTETTNTYSVRVPLVSAA